jgi:hypothetical protein
LAAVKKEGKWIFIGTDGEVAITNDILNHASYPRQFHNGYSLVSVSFSEKYNGGSSSGKGDYKVMENSWYALDGQEGGFIYKQPRKERKMMKSKIDSFQRARRR